MIKQLKELAEIINDNVKKAKEAKLKNDTVEYHLFKGMAYGVNSSISTLELLNSERVNNINEKILNNEYITSIDLIED